MSNDLDEPPIVSELSNHIGMWRHSLVEIVYDGGNPIGIYNITLGNSRDGPTFIDFPQEEKFEGLHKLKIAPSVVALMLVSVTGVLLWHLTTCLFIIK